MGIELPEDLVEQQRAANAEHARLLKLQERFGKLDAQSVPPSRWTDEQRAAWDAQQKQWAKLLPDLHRAVSEFAAGTGASRYEVETALKQAAKTETVAA